MEKVKFNATEYDLVVNGVQLTDQGGKVIFLPAAATFAEIEADMKTMKAIIVQDSAGEPILTRTDLVYAGYIAKDDNYVIGTEQIQIGIDPETGEPITDTQDVIGTVMIAKFRAPDLREKYTALEAKVEYLSMMAGVDLEEV